VINNGLYDVRRDAQLLVHDRYQSAPQVVKRPSRHRWKAVGASGSTYARVQPCFNFAKTRHWRLTCRCENEITDMRGVQQHMTYPGRKRYRGAVTTILKVKDALEKAGIEFIPAGAGKGPGVRLSQEEQPS